MILKSFAYVENKLTPIDVELILLPGLPQIHFLGLADQGIKELDRKIRSAFKQQGFEFPRAQQVIVNLRPVHLKKKSKGLDLAVAVALLMETRQIPKMILGQSDFVYGELSLLGQLQTPEDLDALPLDSDSLVLSGASEGVFSFPRVAIHELRDLCQPFRILGPQAEAFHFERPSLGLSLKYNSREARFLKMIALGEHNTLLAGPPGTGKSTWAKALPSFLLPPTASDWKEIKELFPERKIVDFRWRSLVQPHHTNTVTSLLGGGVPVRPGDLSRAHRGVLIMDEFLEFHPQVQEALREPLEEGVLRLSRKTELVELKTQFLLLATTNLCPCGHWLPGQMSDCQRSRLRCQSSRQKLSGPLLDRFDVIYLKEGEGEKSVGGDQILSELEEIRSQARTFTNEVEIPESMKKLSSSQRRWKALGRVALSLSRLDRSEKLKSKHWEEALEYSLWPFRQLTENLMDIL